MKAPCQASGAPVGRLNKHWKDTFQLNRATGSGWENRRTRTPFIIIFFFKPNELKYNPPHITATKAQLSVLLHPWEKKAQFKNQPSCCHQRFFSEKEKTHPESTSCPAGGGTAKKKEEKKKNRFTSLAFPEVLTLPKKQSRSDLQCSVFFWARRKKKFSPKNNERLF